MIHSAKTQFKITLPRLPWLPLRMSQRKLLLASVDLVLLNGALLQGLHLNPDMPLSLPHHDQRLAGVDPGSDT